MVSPIEKRCLCKVQGEMGGGTVWAALRKWYLRGGRQWEGVHWGEVGSREKSDWVVLPQEEREAGRGQMWTCGREVGEWGECMRNLLFKIFLIFFIIFSKVFYWNIVDLQCFRCTVKWFRYIYLNIYIYMNIFFFRFFSIIAYYKILSIVSCAIQ